MKLEYSIIIVGCGGTGANVIMRLGQYFFENENTNEIIVIDGDTVEMKNISRQPFIEDEVNCNKAEAIAEALRETYNVKTRYYPHYIESVNQIKELVQPDTIPILIGAVDNFACRKIMHQYFTETSNIYYIDSANGYAIGEVVMSFKLSNIVLFGSRIDFFPEIMNDKSPGRSKMSCTELNESEPQHLITNLLAASIVLSGLIGILTDQGFEGGIYYFDAFKPYVKISKVRL